MAASWWSQLSWVLSFRSIFDLGPEGRGSSRSPLHDLLHKISQTRSPPQLSGSRFTRKSKTCRYRDIVPPQPITYQCHINRAWPSPFSPPPSVAPSHQNSFATIKRVTLRLKNSRHPPGVPTFTNHARKNSRSCAECVCASTSRQPVHGFRPVQST